MLRRWRGKLGSAATYGKLLQLSLEAGHTQCAEAEVLRNKCKCSYNIVLVCKAMVSLHADAVNVLSGRVTSS